ncbi:hypothetical protein DRP04_12460, partial [Archaeoglobales archaeon]
LFSYLVTGATSPYWDEGEELSWVKDAVEFIKDDIAKNGYKGDIVVGLADGLPEKVRYIAQESDLNVKIVRITKPRIAYIEIYEYVDLRLINTLKPEYLIVGDSQYEIQFTKKVREEILRNYTVVFHSNTIYSYNGYVLKRKDIEIGESVPHEEESLEIEGGYISAGFFRGSVPGVMKLGNTYTAIVQVKNLKDAREKFAIKMHCDDGTVYIRGSFREEYLDKNSIYIFRFILVPITEFNGRSVITADLYIESDNGTFTKVDSVSDTVYMIIK